MFSSLELPNNLASRSSGQIRSTGYRANHLRDQLMRRLKSVIELTRSLEKSLHWMSSDFISNLMILYGISPQARQPFFSRKIFVLEVGSFNDGLLDLIRDYLSEDSNL